MDRKELFIFIDPGYLEGIGHYENYGAQMRQEAHRRGVRFWHIVSRSVPRDTVAAHGLTPLFLRPAFLGSVLHQPDELEFAITAFASKLHLVCRRIIKEGLEDHRIILFMYTGHPAYLPSMAGVLNEPLFQGLDIQCYFNLFYADNGFARKLGCAEYVKTLSFISQELECRDPGQKISLCADSERIRNIYGPYFRRAFSLIPIPLTSGKPVIAPAEKEAQSRSPVTLGFLGYTHAKQGYPFIRRLYHDLLSSSDFVDVRLCVRHNIFNADPSNAENLRDLLSRNGRIDNYINYLSPSEYLALMDKCGIILIPHSQEEYPVQTSGMFIDALSRGKIVVVPENTWLSDQLTTYGSGVTFSGNSYERFFDAVKTAVLRCSSLNARRHRNLDKFCQFHSAKSLFDILLSPSKPKKNRPSPLSERNKRTATTRPCGLQEEEIQLLSLDIFRQHREAVEQVYREKIKREMTLGWHYVLDLAWIIEQMRDVPPGATILDAGAGMGLLQFLLIASGYRVISVDFAPRHSPPADIPTLKICQKAKFEHKYIEHLSKHYPRPHCTVEPTVLGTQKEFVTLLAKEKAPLIFYQADLLNMTLLPDASVDAVVSVSAIEHIDLDQVGKAIEECLRVLKPGGPLLATTSAARDATWYHQPSRGWCYNEKKIRKIFRLRPSSSSNFADYSCLYEELSRPGNELHVQLAPFYMSSPHNGMPWGVWKPEYLPVGVRKTKQDGDQSMATKVQPSC